MDVSRLQRFGALAALLSIFVLNGCAAQPDRSWGSDITWVPSRSELADAAIESAKSPRVWAPLAGAALFQIDDWDRKVSNWARDKTPVFGSQQSAADWSDHLRTASSIAYFTSVLVTPGPRAPSAWLSDKSQGLLVGLGAIAVTGLATSTLKSATGRRRPNGQGRESFPSGHTSHSAVLTGLARDNLDDLDLGPITRGTLDVGLDALTIGTGWARVEAGAHFPSDTLVAMALGNFVSAFFDRAFMGSNRERRPTFAFAPMPRGGIELQWSMDF